MSDPLHIEAILGFVRSRVSYNVDVAVICGSGLSGLVDIIQNAVSVPFEDIPHFPQSTVAGHGSELVFGDLHGHKVVAAKGRFHYYEGNTPAVVGLQVRLFAALGAKVLIVTNAAGGLNKTFKVGDVMLIRDHISLLGLAGIHPLVGANDARFGPRFPAQGSAVYTPELQDALRAAAAATGLTSALREGVYAGVSGPTYESPAEIHALRILGGDTVGMSTVTEVSVAAHCGLRVLGLSLVTNVCLGPGDVAPPPNHEEVLQATKERAVDLQRLVAHTISLISTAQLPATVAEQAFAHVPPRARAAPAVEATTKVLLPLLAVTAGALALLYWKVMGAKK